MSDLWMRTVPAIVYTRRVTGSSPIATIVTVGPQITEVLGYTPPEVVSDPELWSSRIHPNDLGRVLAALRRATERAEPYHLNYRMIARDDRVLHVLDEAGVASDPSDGATSWHGIVADVTADALSGPELRDAEEKYRQLVEQIPAVTYIDEVVEDDRTDLTPIYISPQLQSLLGYSPQEWLKDPDLWDRVTHPDDFDATMAAAQSAFEQGTPLRIEYRMIARDGRTVWVREEASLFRDAEGNPKFWQGIYVDITELKRAEEELSRTLGRERDASERLRALDEMKNTFLQAVSHDLRTPLAAILGLALTLEREDLDLDESEVRDMATRIASNSRKLDRMVADLLDLDRLSRGIVEPKLRAAEIGALVTEIVAGFGFPEDRQVNVDVEPVTTPVDRPKLERIVENLLVNAVRHTPKGTQVWVRVRREGSGVLIVVEDEGPGVPGDLRNAIFEAFQQGPSRSSHSPGAGVGLALVARFAELHGGRAWVQDRPGGGASFRVFIPGPSVE